jgi:hypothetical protein
MAHLRYKPSMNMHHQNAYITLGKTKCMPWIFKQGEKSFKDRKSSREEGQKWKMQLVQMSNLYLYLKNSI